MPTAPLTVLLVVEDATHRMDLADGLEVAGFAVLEAPDGSSAVAVLRKERAIRLVFADMDLPGSMNGAMLAAAVAHEWPSVKIIVAADEAVSHGLPEQGSTLKKPYGRHDVTKALRALLAG